MPTIPSYQTLGPKSGWSWRRNEGLPYPLGHPRSRDYYLGRNAVFHGAIALRLGAGDEILFPSYHSGSEAAPLMHLGCKLRFYGVGSNLQVDLQAIESRIGPDTKALYMIHFFGFPGPIAELRELADRHHLILIEDVALSFLSRIDHRPLGSWGDIAIFCLYKTMPLAAGGILVINRAEVDLPSAAKGGSLYSELNLTVKHALDHAELHGGRLSRFACRQFQRCVRALVAFIKPELKSPHAMELDPSMLDWAMGPITRTLLRYFDYASAAQRRRRNYQWLAGRLRNTGVIMLREELPPEAVPLFFPILVEDKSRAVARLRQTQIEAVPVWAVHHPYLDRGEFPGTEFLVDHLVEIPIYQDLSDGHLKQIAKALIEQTVPSDSAQLFAREPPPTACDASAGVSADTRSSRGGI